MTKHCVALVPVLIGVALLLTGCSDSPPTGFTAVAPAGLSGAAATCPDLRGTFDITDDALAAQFLRQRRPDDYGYPLQLTISGEPNGIQRAQWHMDRAAFLDHARTLRQTDPAGYGAWRERLLSRDREIDVPRYIEQVTAHGPFFAIDAGLESRHCQDHWRLTAMRDVRPGGDASGTPQERYVWLARNASGALLVKTELANVNEIGILDIAPRTTAGTTWKMFDVLAPADLTPITAADLP